MSLDHLFECSKTKFPKSIVLDCARWDPQDQPGTGLAAAHDLRPGVVLVASQARQHGIEVQCLVHVFHYKCKEGSGGGRKDRW